MEKLCTLEFVISKHKTKKRICGRIAPSLTRMDLCLLLLALGWAALSTPPPGLILQGPLMIRMTQDRVARFSCASLLVACLFARAVAQRKQRERELTMLSSSLRNAAVRGKTAFISSSSTANIARRTMAGNVESTTSSVSLAFSVPSNSDDSCVFLANLLAPYSLIIFLLTIFLLA